MLSSRYLINEVVGCGQCGIERHCIRFVVLSVVQEAGVPCVDSLGQVDISSEY